MFCSKSHAGQCIASRFPEGNACSRPHPPPPDGIPFTCLDPHEITADFAEEQGLLLDDALRTRAAQRESQGTNWLFDEWYSAYLTTRGPLPLTTNVGFQLSLPTGATGIDRVVERIQRAIAVHLQSASGDLPENVDARGNRITQNQWSVPEGFGIAYTPLTDDGEFCVSFNAFTAERPNEFTANLTEAGALLWRFCGELSAES